MRWVVAAALALMSCAGMQDAHMRRASSGNVPCTPEEITVRQTSSSAVGNVTWIATCRGEAWYCRQFNGGVLGGGTMTHSCVRR